MLFKEIHLKGIKSGKVNLAFRKWKKPAVKQGSLLHTSVGMIKINNILSVTQNSITEHDAIQAGYESKTKLLRALRGEGNIYKIEVSYHSEDPRLKLSAQTKLTDAELEELKIKILRMDKSGKQGAWTTRVLILIMNNPKVHAIELAKRMRVEKEWLKLNIRKLKNLGLTISYAQGGYELSPLGKWYVKKQKLHRE